MKETFDEKNPVGGPGFSIINNNIQHEYSPESTTTVKQQLDISELINEAVLNLRQRGLNVSAHDLDLSGELTRCGLIGKPNGNKDGAYLVHTDQPACAWFQNFVSGESGTFTISSGSSENNTMTDQERRALHEKIELNRQKKDAKNANKHKNAAIEANRLYDKASSDEGQVNQHAYATSKMVEFGPEVRRGYWEQRDPNKAKTQEELEKSWPEDHCLNALIIPAFNQQGELASLQAISPSGKKDFLFGGKIAGSYCTIGPSFLNAKTICVVEGYVTGAAVHSATGLPVVVAFSAGNLMEVGQIVRKLAPEAEVVFCADDDQKPDKNENPGINAATLAAKTINGKLAKPEMGRKADFWDFWREHGPEALKNAIDKASPVCIDAQADRDCACYSDDDHASELDFIQKPVGELFPRVPFPWLVLPTMIETCVKQLARSCATSPLPLPGLIFCMVGAAVGRKYCVSAKASWQEPSVTWYADIRESGSGKTPAMTALLDVFKKLQDAENKRHKEAEAAYKRLSPEDKKEVDPPGRERRYYVDQITLEGLHAELVDHPTGGILASAHELSTMFNGQGEYKGGKGTDRERYLTLHDGKGGAITRKAETIDFAPAAVQFCGGVQPMVFAQLFSKNNGGTYLVDGTIFRFLLSNFRLGFCM
ncbi:MAG: DUF3987 domain-containing protein [Proteobacteria bacterium]|nr:DUF3987 domain-containing protein [Pseudomonadota bacterium]